MPYASRQRRQPRCDCTVSSSYTGTKAVGIWVSIRCAFIGRNVRVPTIVEACFTFSVVERSPGPNPCAHNVGVTANGTHCRTSALIVCVRNDRLKERQTSWLADVKIFTVTCRPHPGAGCIT